MYNFRTVRIGGEKVGAEWQKKVEAALRESERRLELALESAGLGLWDHNLKTGEVIRNKRWAEMLGYTLEELGADAQTWKNLIHPDDLPMVVKIARDHEEGKIPFFKVEHRLRAKNGEWKWVLNWGKVVERDENGRPVRATGTHLDITERKQEEEERLKLEAQIQQAQKFESLNVMAGSIAHNFNNLLMAVLGNLELASEKLPVDSPLKRNIDNAARAAEHAAELSTLMLTYVGKTEVKMEVINITEVVEEMMAVLELALSKKAKLQFNCSPAPVFFKGDPARIRQVIMNLVTNAAEAVGDTHGTITMTTGTVFCERACFQQPFIKDDLPEGNYVYLEISDTGCGMDRETINKIFDPFFTTKFLGRGLGMAVVLGILRAHRGLISLDSRPGKGTKVRVLFPALDIPGKGSVKIGKVVNGWCGSGTILLVDDQESILDVGEQMLERLGFHVLTAANGLEAIDIFREQGEIIDCVLLDYSMPDLDGRETLNVLHCLRNDVPVILSSGYTEEHISKSFVDVFPADFIQKPYQLSILAEKLQKVLNTE